MRGLGPAGVSKPRDAGSGYGGQLFPTPAEGARYDETLSTVERGVHETGLAARQMRKRLADDPTGLAFLDAVVGLIDVAEDSIQRAINGVKEPTIEQGLPGPTSNQGGLSF